MANMSFLQRIWKSIIRSPRVYVGQDLKGNRFYEYPAPSYDSRGTKRVVQYKHPDDMWKYIGGGERLPVQWSSWLTHTRLHPPTLEELQADLERQLRVRTNAALIEARDSENRAKSIAEGTAALEEARRTRIEQRAKNEQPERQLPEPGTSSSSSRYDEAPSLEEVRRQGDLEGHHSIRKPKTDSETRKTVEESTKSPWVEHTEDTLKPQSWTPQMYNRGK